MPAGKLKLAAKAKPKKKLATVAYVNKAIHKNIENKFHYGTLVTPFASVTSTWSEQAFGLIGRGTEVNRRIGNSITVKSIQLEMVIVGGAVNSVADDARNTIRMVLASWDGDSNTPLGTATWNMDYPIRRTLGPTASNMLKKYYDKYITIPSIGPDDTGYVAGMRKVSYYKYFKKGYKMNFADATENYPDKRLILSMISDSGVVPNPGVTNGYYVITYEDA